MELVILVFVVYLALCSMYLLIKSRKHDGKLVLRTTEEGKTVYTLQLECDPEELMHKRSISFKVDSSSKETENS